MSTLILPCAGRSTRFPNSRPKWSLTHPYGELMIIQAIKGLDLSEYDKIVPVFVKKDLDKFGLRDGIIKSFEKLNINYEIVELENTTKSQSETVTKAIEKLNIQGNILIKDCDGYFTGKFDVGNFVYVCSLQDVDKINAKSKSYVDVDTNGFIKTIVEKDVISSLFCCGGYSFSDANKFVQTYKKLLDFSKDEIYISHVIYQQILDGETFNIEGVSNFRDWGTLNDWDEYKKQYKTLFIDLDGVLVENSGEYVGNIWGTTKDLENNKNYINKLYNSGKTRIIITTSRKSSYKNETLSQLNNLGIKFHDIIFDLLHCQRILINDFSSSNSYPTSKSVNLPRNNDNLDDYLKENF